MNVRKPAVTPSLPHLANQVCDGNLREPGQRINDFFKSVSDHLHALRDTVVTHDITADLISEKTVTSADGADFELVALINRLFTNNVMLE